MGRVAIIHPDLGIGGAERLIVDASKALQEKGHKVSIYTGYHDKTRCFDEVKDGTLYVEQIGGWIPRTIFGRFHALMAYLKMIIIAIYLFFKSEHDLVLCDQVSACIPFLKLDFKNRARIIFYCHFPDQLLTSRDSLLKSLYRKPIDLFEEISTNMADVILVNSQFTSSVVKKTFKSLKNRELNVLYPCVDLNRLTTHQPNPNKFGETISKSIKHCENNFVFLSLNRFERKKNLKLAIEAFSKFKNAVIQDETKNIPGVKAHLIVAGGLDVRLMDSMQYYKELKCLVNELKLEPFVTFVESPNDDEKIALLRSCHAVLYTPENEHFGIVPLEAMAMSKPVVASASGGPLETVEDGASGFLCHADSSSFAKAMVRLYSDRQESVKLGKSGLEKVVKRFSYESFRDKLARICYPSSE